MSSDHDTHLVCECGHDRFEAWAVVRSKGKDVTFETVMKCENCHRAAPAVGGKGNNE